MKRSENIAGLCKAMAAFQEEVKNPKNVASNTLYNNSKYAPLDEIVSVVRPILGKNKLSFVQEACGDLENVSITTLLMHESGEWIETEPFLLKGEQSIKGGGKVLNIQGAGSMITYAKRYQLCALLGISSEDDDDGNAGSERDKTKVDALKMETLRERLKVARVKEDAILETYELLELKDMTVSMFMDAMNKLEKQIKLAESKKKNDEAATKEDVKNNQLQELEEVI